jgi:imidazole glycerol-phosphate synthase subunit HisF
MGRLISLCHAIVRGTGLSGTGPSGTEANPARDFRLEISGSRFPARDFRLEISGSRFLARASRGSHPRHKTGAIQCGVITKRIIPCLDVDRGRVTRGVQYQNVREIGDPIAYAQRYDLEGADELVFYDITASSDGREIDLGWANSVAETVFMPLTIGGGVRTLEDCRRLHLAGADKISIDSGAVANPDVIRIASDHFGAQCVVLSMQVKRRANGKGWETFVKGGREPTGLDALEWAARGQALGAGELVLNSIDGDGTKAGYDVELCAAVKAEVDIPVIASGGAGRLEDFLEVLTRGRADAALAASVFHFGTYSVREVKAYLHANGVPVRLETEIVGSDARARA